MLRRLTVAIACAALLGFAVTQSRAQEKEFTLKVKASQVQLLGKALGLLPYGEVAPFMGELQTQINAQNEPPKVEAPAVPLPPVAPAKKE